MTRIADGWDAELLTAYPHDLGSGVRYKEMVADCGGPVVGIIEAHLAPDGGLCAGAVDFDVPENIDTGPRWRVVSRHPLTLEPSVLCRACGHHGFIRAGRWEST